MMQRDLPSDLHTLVAFGLDWASAVGAFAAVLLCALFVPKLWLPAVVLGIYLLLRLINRRMDRHVDRPAYEWTVTTVAEYTLVATGLIMVAILLVNRSPSAMRLLADPAAANPDIPYVTILILAPTAFAVSLLGYLRLRPHRPARPIFLKQMIYREWCMQLRMLAMASALVAAYAWTYYFLRYSNVNYNSADRFFFIYLPLLLCGLSLLKMYVHYSMLALFIKRNVIGFSSDCPMITTVRFLILCGDKVLLRRDKEDGDFDTPARTKLPHREDLTDDDLSALLFKVAGRRFRPAVVKLLYENADMSIACNVVHCLCVVDSPSQLACSDLYGEWTTFDRIIAMIEDGSAATALGEEVMRIYAVVMASKCYDRRGRRRYPVRNYQPTFRLSELPELDVDFGDMGWLRVVRDNEDRPFYRLRRLWRRYVYGLDDESC